MDVSAVHIGFVIAAYAVSAIVLVGLLVSTIARDRFLRRKLRQLEPVSRKERP